MIKIANVITISDGISTDSFTDNQIIEASVFLVQSVNGDELPYNTCSFTVDARTYKGTKFIPKGSTGMLTAEKLVFTVLPRLSEISGDVQKYDASATVTIEHDAKLLGKFYVSSVKRVSPTQYHVDGISSIGLLETLTHYGGLYTKETPASTILYDIFAGTGIRFSIADELNSALLKGWLPIATRRANLHQVLFALNAGATTDAQGNIHISPLYQKNLKIINGERVFLSGEVEYPDKVGSITVAQHEFTSTESSEPVVLFEGYIPDDSYAYDPDTGVKYDRAILIKFDEPIIKTEGNGLYAKNGNNNYGLYQRITSADTKIVLKGYIGKHTSKQITEILPTAGNKNAMAKDVEQQYLVSELNIGSVMKRLKSYYSSAKTISTSIKVTDELPGDAVRLTDPFGDVTDGIIRSMNIKLGKNLKADIEVIADYTPPLPSGLYNKVDVITSNRNWVVPANVTDIRVVLIGGGQGGNSGLAGDMGKGMDSDTGTGNGGSGGRRGDGGKIFQTSMTVSPGQSFAVRIGTGGYGGSASSSHTSYNTGSYGSPTTFGNFSSNSGSSSESGYTGMQGIDNDRVYGLPGRDGVSGGNGGKPTSAPGSVTDPITGIRFTGGRTGPDKTAWFGVSNGGLGGGPAVGQNGTDGGYGNIYEGSGSKRIIGGYGGNGGTANNVTSTSIHRGDGGDGGYGGGGGGFGGSAFATESGVQTLMGINGNGGNGGAGGRGNDGVALIYYFQKG